MLSLIKTVFTTFPPESTAALVVAILIIIGWFTQSSLKWFLEFNCKRQDVRDKAESDHFEKSLGSKEKEIEDLKNNNTVLLQKTYESIRKLNENNTGITREEFDNLIKKVRDIDNMTRQELNELRSEVNKILGRLEKN